MPPPARPTRLLPWALLPLLPALVWLLRRPRHRPAPAPEPALAPEVPAAAAAPPAAPLPPQLATWAASGTALAFGTGFAYFMGYVNRWYYLRRLGVPVASVEFPTAYYLTAAWPFVLGALLLLGLALLLGRSAPAGRLQAAAHNLWVFAGLGAAAYWATVLPGRWAAWAHLPPLLLLLAGAAWWTAHRRSFARWFYVADWGHRAVPLVAFVLTALFAAAVAGDRQAVRLARTGNDGSRTVVLRLRDGAVFAVGTPLALVVLRGGSYYLERQEDPVPRPPPLFIVPEGEVAAAHLGPAATAATPAPGTPAPTPTRCPARQPVALPSPTTRCRWWPRAGARAWRSTGRDALPDHERPAGHFLRTEAVSDRCTQDLGQLPVQVPHRPDSAAWATEIGDLRVHRTGPLLVSVQH